MLHFVCYISKIEFYLLRITPYSLSFNPASGAPPEVSFIYVLRTGRYFIMTKYFDPDLSQETLESYRGYSLQVFASGRIKLSFHRSQTGQSRVLRGKAQALPRSL